MAYQVVKSERVFEGKVFNVRIDHVQHPSGRTMRVDLIEHHGAVILVPMDEQGRFWLIRQYRHATGKTILEVPAGTLDPEEGPEACARRECREEIGMDPGELVPLGGFYMAPGYSTEYAHVFLARHLRPAPLTPDEDEDIRVLPMDLEQVRKALDQGAIEDGKTLASLFLALRHLNLPLW
jgi:ADP-ribose pyrophosphatase